MAVSSTENAPDNFSRQDANMIISATAQYISQWTQHEFNKLSKNKRIPLIWPLSKGSYRIGNNFIVAHHGYWQLQNYHREPIYEFDSKQSAIFYCLCEQTGHNYIADQIYNTDIAVKKHRNDVIYHEASLARAEKAKDLAGISIWTARLQEARLHLDLAQKSLKKSIESAKYLKVWTE